MADFSQPASSVQVLTQCRGALSAFLKGHLDRLMESIDDTLFELADKAGSGAEQNMYFDAMRILRLKRSVLCDDLVSHCARRVEDLLQASPGPAAKAPEAILDLEMGLLENDELERNLAVDDMVAKTRRRCESALYLVGQRLSALCARDQIEGEANPFDPQPIVQAFKKMSLELELEIKIELILYKLFDKRVLSEIEALYETLNRKLEQAGVLPGLEAPRPGAGGQGRPAPTRVTAPNAEARTVADSGPFVSQAEAQGPAGEGDLLAVLGQLMAARGAGAAPSGAPGAAVPANPPVAGGPHVVAGAELVRALTRFQQQAPASDGSVDWGSLRLGVVGDVRERSGSESAEIGQVEDSTIELVSLLFDFVFDDQALPNPVKVLIGRLQIPILKLALLDKSFFNRKNHPARRLLNELSRAGLGWSESGEGADDLLATIEALVGRVLAEFDDDPEIFNEVLARFLAYREEARRDALAQELSVARRAQDRERLKIARQVAARSIEGIIGEAGLPEAFERFLKGLWQDFLVKIYYAKGADSRLWEKALNVAAMLVWSVTPKGEQTDREELVGVLPGVLKSVREGMRSMGSSEAEQESVLSRLAIEHARVVQDLEQGAAQTSPLETPAPASPEALEPDPVAGDAPAPVFEPQDEAALETAQPEDEGGRSFMARKVGEINRMLGEGRFQVYDENEVRRAHELAESMARDADVLAKAKALPDGTWLAFEQEEGEPQRAKLSWKSLISGKFFFVDQKGLKYKELLPEELAALMRDGQARVIEETPVLERAIASLVSSMAPEATQAADTGNV